MGVVIELKPSSARGLTDQSVMRQIGATTTKMQAL
jgi:hypothetical protein